MAKLDSADGDLIFSSYHGGNRKDKAQAVATDGLGGIVVVGLTKSKKDFPLQNAYQTSLGGGTDAFVSKLSADGAEWIYSTYLGGKRTDEALTVAMDADGAAHIAGYTGSKKSFPLTASVQTGYGGGSKDAFLAKFRADGDLVFSSYFGGQKKESVQGIVAPTTTGIFVTGTTESWKDFPFSPTAIQGNRMIIFEGNRL